MSQLNEWALAWGVPYLAVLDLQQRLGVIPTDPPPMAGKSEAAVQNAERLKASELGGRLWRNNVGAYKPKGGGFVRYGLCNDTEQLNEQLKSSDLIGIFPLLIQPQHVGTIVGQFWAIECKEGDWAGVTDEHEKAQEAFGHLVIALGGRFQFSRG